MEEQRRKENVLQDIDYNLVPSDVSDREKKQKKVVSTGKSIDFANRGNGNGWRGNKSKSPGLVSTVIHGIFSFLEMGELPSERIERLLKKRKGRSPLFNKSSTVPLKDLYLTHFLRFKRKISLLTQNKRYIGLVEESPSSSTWEKGNRSLKNLAFFSLQQLTYHAAIGLWYAVESGFIFVFYPLILLINFVAAEIRLLIALFSSKTSSTELRDRTFNSNKRHNVAFRPLFKILQKLLGNNKEAMPFWKKLLLIPLLMFIMPFYLLAYGIYAEIRQLIRFIVAAIILVTGVVGLIAAPFFWLLRAPLHLICSLVKPKFLILFLPGLVVGGIVLTALLFGLGALGVNLFLPITSALMSTMTFLTIVATLSFPSLLIVVIAAGGVLAALTGLLLLTKNPVRTAMVSFLFSLIGNDYKSSLFFTSSAEKQRIGFSLEGEALRQALTKGNEDDEVEDDEVEDDEVEGDNDDSDYINVSSSYQKVVLPTKNNDSTPPPLKYNF